MPPQRTVFYQQWEWQYTHFLGKTLPCTFWGNGNRTAMALLLANDEEAIFSKMLVVRWSIGNAKRVGQQCVGQPEELRSENQITRGNPIAPWCEHRIRAKEGGQRIDRIQEQTSVAEATFWRMCLLRTINIFMALAMMSLTLRGNREHVGDGDCQCGNLLSLVAMQAWFDPVLQLDLLQTHPSRERERESIVR